MFDAMITILVLIALIFCIKAAYVYNNEDLQ